MIVVPLGKSRFANAPALEGNNNTWVRKMKWTTLYSLTHSIATKSKGDLPGSVNGGLRVHNVIDAFSIFVEPINRSGGIGLEEDPYVILFYG